jgi:Ca2+-binding RTX toxin-like protein
MVGARSAKAGGNLRGETYVIYGGAFTGNDPITQTGTTAAEMLIGGLGADTLTGGGGADIIRSGAGNDTIGVTGTDFVKIDGGSGYDTLRIDGASDVFDFATIKNTAVDSIEAIDMGVVGSQSLSLSKLDLFHLSDDTSGGMTRLTIHGGAGDTVSATDAGWTANGTTTIGSDTFRIFDNGHAELLVDSDITLSGVLGDL